jgi:hypothetical protein
MRVQNIFIAEIKKKQITRLSPKIMKVYCLTTCVKVKVKVKVKQSRYRPGEAQKVPGS